MPTTKSIAIRKDVYNSLMILVGKMRKLNNSAVEFEDKEGQVITENIEIPEVDASLRLVLIPENCSIRYDTSMGDSIEENLPLSDKKLSEVGLSIAVVAEVDGCDDEEVDIDTTKSIGQQADQIMRYYGQRKREGFFKMV
ncbi:hypothetical protein [Liquorilactobacillus mali]|nr:hypothetical protein [Liquorilactobacillus mali]